MTTLPSLFNLTRRTAIVTGGAGLLGAEFCHTLAAAGANVIVADLDADRAASIADELAQTGLSARAAAVDVTDPVSTQALARTALEAYGSLDILVNSAALDPKFDPHTASGSARPAAGRARPTSGAFEDFPLEAWRQALDVNLTGMFLCCQAAVKPMLAQGRGVIVNICSMYGLVGPDQRLYERPEPDAPRQFKPVYYSVTKAGVLGLTRYLATYYAGKNIRANALTPGGVYNGHDDVFLQAYAARSVLGRMAEKNEMNGALLFLASDASSYMTGSNLVVDGGWTAW